ncbi:unnamed protein product [Lampetra fluviatilis]
MSPPTRRRYLGSARHRREPEAKHPEPDSVNQRRLVRDDNDDSPRIVTEPSTKGATGTSSSSVSLLFPRLSAVAVVTGGTGRLTAAGNRRHVDQTLSDDLVRNRVAWDAPRDLGMSGATQRVGSGEGLARGRRTLADIRDIPRNCVASSRTYNERPKLDRRKRDAERAGGLGLGQGGDK